MTGKVNTSTGKIYQSISTHIKNLGIHSAIHPSKILPEIPDTAKESECYTEVPDAKNRNSECPSLEPIVNERGFVSKSEFNKSEVAKMFTILLSFIIYKKYLLFTKFL